MKRLNEYARELGVKVPMGPAQDHVNDLVRSALTTLLNDIETDKMTAAALKAQTAVAEENQKLIQQVTDEIVSLLEKQTQALMNAYSEISEKVSSLQVEVKNPIDEKAMSGYADSLKKAVVANAKATDNNMKDIKKALANIKPQMPKIDFPEIEIPEPVTEWEFVFIRNDKGFTDTIKAKAMK